MAFTVMTDVPNPLFDQNGNPFSGAVLKAYVPGTTTPISIYIDDAGSSPQASITYNSEGKLEVSGNEILPYIDRKHKWGIFANTTDAAADTPFYMGPFDDVDQNASISGTNLVKNFSTLAEAVADTSLVDGDALNIAERTTGNGGGGIWDVVLSSTVTENTYNIVQCTGVATLSLVLREGQYEIDKWGAVSGVDSTGAIQAILDAGKSPKGTDGTFLITSQLTTTANGQRISGNGVGKTIFKSSGLASTDAIIYSENYSDVEIYGIEFDCNAECYMGIRFTLDSPLSDKSDISAHHCKVSNTFNFVTSLYGGITVDNKQGAGFTYQYVDVNIYRNIFDTDTASNSCHGCIVAYAKDIKFQDNQVDSAGFHGMEAVGCDGVLETGNTIRDCFESGLGVGSNTKNFVISNNAIYNCDGDGAITVEQNSVQGHVIGNVITNCTNNGINVSFGSAGSAPFNEVNNIIISDNLVMAAASGEGRIGINAYSSTGGAIGTGIQIKNNIFDGFATGIECTWLDFAQINGNTVRRFGTVSVGRPNKTFISIVGTDKFSCRGNICEQEVTDHAIVIDTSTVANSRGIVSDNVIQSATAGALVRKIGNGEVTVTNNKTFGAVNFVSCDGAQQVTLGDNVGPLTGNPITGGVVVNRVTNLTGSPEGVIAALKGATCTRVDGGASTSFYVKTADNGLNTGWTAK